jgi:hypothetical protein
MSNPLEGGSFVKSDFVRSKGDGYYIDTIKKGNSHNINKINETEICSFAKEREMLYYYIIYDNAVSI